MDLIFAEATPPGRGGVSVVRISGPGARDAAEQLVGPMAEPRHAYLRQVVEAGEVLDHALAIWFPAGGSFTGEEVAELQLHGAPVVVRRVSAALLRQGARPADAGEFTRRAFINGRMDLSEIEGLGDLLAAETEMQRKQALRTAGGELSRTAERWRGMLIEAGALVEVSVDFADEDVPDEVPARVFEIVATLRDELRRELDGFGSAERLRQGFEVAIVGPPNAGKSSLLNYLAKRDVAIVSDRAGTTRDVIELRYDLRGLPVTFLDTAGLREAQDDVERIGIDRARSRATAADLRIHLSRDGGVVEDVWRDGDMAVRGHADLDGVSGGEQLSAVTGEGVDHLLQRIFDALSDRVSSGGLVSHERQRADIAGAAETLEIDDALPAEIVAEHLRHASQFLDKLVGRIAPDDYLDRIFSSFCIGK